MARPLAAAMWLIFTRAPAPDAPYWPGRRAFALVDALAWPAAWIAWVTRMPVEAGAVGQVIVAACILAALTRSHRALLRNHRYRFTTWRWGSRLLVLVGFGYALRLAAMLLSR